MNEAGQGGWLDELLQTLAERRRRLKRRWTVRLELERLEDRLAPATTINIFHGINGAGTLDNILAMNQGVISTTDGGKGGTQPETLSDSALATVGAQFGLNITARNSISFDSTLQGSLDLGSNPVAFHANNGDITFANQSYTLMVDSGGSGSFFFQASGKLDLGNLDASPFETINLQAGGSLSAGALTAVNGFISIQAGGAVALNGVVDAGNGAYGGYVTLNAGGPVTQAAPIQAMQLMLDGSGSFFLTDSGNAVDVLADSAVNDGYTGGAVAFVDSTALTLGVASDVNIGVVTSNAPISIVAGGLLTVDYNVSAGAAPVDLTVNAPGQELKLDSNAGTAPAISGAAVTLTADVMSLSAGPINAGGGPVALQTLTPSLGIDLGGAGSGGSPGSPAPSSQADLSLAQADLDTITAGVLSIGDGFAGDITIDGLVSDSSAGWNTLVLVTGADVNETAGAGFLQVENLALVAGEGIGDDGVLLTGATNLAFDNAAGVVDIENAGTLNLTAVDGLGTSSNDGSTTLAASGALTVEVPVASDGATTLAASGSLTVEAPVVNGGSTTLETSGALTVEADVTSGGPTTLAAAGPLTVEADVTSGGSTTLETSGALTVEADLVSGGPTTLAAVGPLTVEADVTSGGTLTLATAEAGGADSPEEDVTVLSGVTIESTGGDVALEAADSVVLEAGSLVKSDAGAVDLAVSVNDPDNDGVFDLQGTIVAPNGVNLSPVPSNLQLALSGTATPGALPTTLSGSFADAAATAEAHTVVIAWGDNSPDTILTLAAGVDTFSSSHVYAAQGNFAATVQVVNASRGSASGDIIVPVLPASFGSVVAVAAQPGQTVTASVTDPTTNTVTTITLVRAAGPGTSGELLAARLLNAFFPPAPGTVEILAAFDFREFNLSPADRAFVSVTFPAVVPPGTVPIVQYLDPDTGVLEDFNPANPPGYLTITVGPNEVTVTLILDDTTIPKLTELTATEFTVTAAVPSVAATATVSQPVASADAGTTATGRTAAFQSTSQLTFGLASSQSVEISSSLLAENAASSGGDAGTPDDPSAAAARAAWAQFVADAFPGDPQAVWEYGGDDAIRLWLLKHPRGVAAPPPVRPEPVPTPAPQPAPPHEEARLQALDVFFLEALEVGNGSAPAALLSAAPPIGGTNDGRRPGANPGATTPLAVPYVLGAAVGGLVLAKPERKRRLKVEGPPEGWRR